MSKKFATMLYMTPGRVVWCAWDKRGMVAGAAVDPREAESQMVWSLRTIVRLREMRGEA